MPDWYIAFLSIQEQHSTQRERNVRPFISPAITNLNREPATFFAATANLGNQKLRRSPLARAQKAVKFSSTTKMPTRKKTTPKSPEADDAMRAQRPRDSIMKRGEKEREGVTQA